MVVRLSRESFQARRASGATPVNVLTTLALQSFWLVHFSSYFKCLWFYISCQDIENEESRICRNFV